MVKLICPSTKELRQTMAEKGSPNNTLLSYSKVPQWGASAHQRPICRNQRSAGMHNGK